MMTDYALPGYRLTYTTDDDGIWVECTRCTWRQCADQSPSLQEVCEIAHHHSCALAMTVSMLQTALATALVMENSEHYIAELHQATERIKAILRPFVPDLVGDADNG